MLARFLHTRAICYYSLLIVVFNLFILHANEVEELV